MENTMQPAGSGAGEGLDFTKSDGSGINKNAHGGRTPGASDFEQKETLSMSNDSTPAKSGVVQVISDTRKPLIQEVLKRLNIEGRARKFFCPAHDNKNTPAASYSGGDGTLWKCHSCGAGGNAWALVMHAKKIGRDDADRWLRTNGFIAENRTGRKQSGKSEPKPPTVHKTLDKACEALTWGLNEGSKVKDWKEVCRTPYYDLNRRAVLYTVRYESQAAADKQFRQITPCNGGYVCRGPQSGIPPLFLPDLDSSKLLVICEGEKAAAAAAAMGLQSTTWAGGADATEKTDWNTLKGFDVVIWPDNDDPGRKAAGKIGAHLATVASRVRILPLDKADGLAEKEDAADVLTMYGADPGRRWFSDLLAQAENYKPSPAVIESTARPTLTIPLEYSNPAELLDKLTPHLAKAGIYQRDGNLCRIVKAGESKVKGIGQKAAGGPVVDLHDVHSITPVIGKTVTFQRERVMKSGEVVPMATEPPMKLMQQLLRLKSWPETPLLVGITRAPFMRPDGTICATPGYDAETGWFLDYDGPPVVVPDNPTDATAKDAAVTLLGLVQDFEFADDSHKVAWLTYLLTLIARPGIDGYIPAHVFTANSPGSGKSLLADVANLVAFGNVPPGYQAPQNAESADEWRKLLFSFAQTGSLSLVISNYPSGQAIGNAPIAMALTEYSVGDRVLGKSETRSPAWVAAMAFTGNNLGSTADFVFRSIWCVLESSEENPRQRTGFKIPDLRKHVIEHRHNLLRKALTILRWHAGNGFPAAGGQPYGSFETWAQVVRDAVMHLTGHDVLKNNEAAEVADVERDELTSFVLGLKEYLYWKANQENQSPVGALISGIYADLTDPANATAFDDLKSLFELNRGRKTFETQIGTMAAKYKKRVVSIGTDALEKVKIDVTTFNKKRYIRLKRV